MFRSALILFASLGLADGELNYEPERIGDWSVRVESVLRKHPRRGPALELLEKHLAEIERTVPAAAVAELKKVTLWVSEKAAAGACYHPSAKWLEENGRVVEMAGCIEIQNIDHFLDWSETQPMMVLHELAHAWHHRVLAEGYRNPEILAAFAVAVESGKYEKVRHADGRETRHYALSNAMEYFAEATEAYFGRNDFSPFQREELRDFDPVAFRLVEKLWGVPLTAPGQ